MTVSRTMSGGRNVRPEVQERVREAAARLGYRPNESARNTRLRRPTGLIGVAVTNLGNPYYGQFALGIEDVAAENNRHILIGNTGEDLERERQLLDDFSGRQVEGLIVVPAGNGQSALGDGRVGPGVPLVLATRAAAGVESDTVLVDDVRGARAGTASLLEDGHRRLAFLGDVSAIPTARRRFDGFHGALQEHGVDFDERLFCPVRDGESALGAVTELLTMDNPPTAFFSTNNRITVGALRAVWDFSRSNPEKPVSALASFDDVELADLLGIPLTVMSHDPRALGAEAARMLFQRLAGEAPPEPRTVSMPVTVRRYGSGG